MSESLRYVIVQLKKRRMFFFNGCIGPACRGDCKSEILPHAFQLKSHLLQKEHVVLFLPPLLRYFVPVQIAHVKDNHIGVQHALFVVAKFAVSGKVGTTPFV